MNQKKFKYRQTGDIATSWENNSNFYNISCGQCIPKKFIENSNDWEEIKEEPTWYYVTGSIEEKRKFIAKLKELGMEPHGNNTNKSIIGNCHIGYTGGNDYDARGDGNIRKMTKLTLPQDYVKAIKAFTGKDVELEEEFTILEFRGTKINQVIVINEVTNKYYDLQDSKISTLWSLNEMLTIGTSVRTGDFYIHSVKRNSDNEVFTIGDKFFYQNRDPIHVIKKIHYRKDFNDIVLNVNEYNWGGIDLKSVKKVTKSEVNFLVLKLSSALYTRTWRSQIEQYVAIDKPDTFGGYTLEMLLNQSEIQEVKCLSTGITFKISDSVYPKEYVQNSENIISFKLDAGKTEVLAITKSYSKGIRLSKLVKVEPKKEPAVYTGEWKVGDELTTDMFNLKSCMVSGYPNSKKWQNPMFIIGNRKIEKIQTINGVWAGLVSGTAGLWIDLSSIKKKPVLFVSADGVNMYEGDFPHWVVVDKPGADTSTRYLGEDYKVGLVSDHAELFDPNYKGNSNYYYKIFSTKEAAQAYIDSLKPKVEKLYSIMSTLNSNITSIKVLSTGVIFSVGDKVCWDWKNCNVPYFIIKGFKELDEEWFKRYKGDIEIGLEQGPNLGNFLHQSDTNFRHYVESKILLTTQDGKVITNPKQYIYCLSTDFKYQNQGLAHCWSGKENWLFFISLEARENYILMNKPVLSYQEIENWCINIDVSGSLRNLLTIVKEKI